MSKVMVMDHPLIQHKIGLIRKKETGTKDFRETISEIAMMICYEATRHLELADVQIETPICSTTVKEIKGRKMAIVPILRAGLGMVDGALFQTALIPGIYLLLMLFPILAATVRRLHDTGKGAAYLLLCFVPALGVIILFVFLC